MKKIFVMGLVLLVFGAISYAQTTPVKQGNSSGKQKKETVKKEAKPASTVSAVTQPTAKKAPASVAKNTAAKNTKSGTPAPVASEKTKAVTATKKSKKEHPAKKQTK